MRTLGIYSAIRIETAIQTLFKRASSLNADILITFDADGQHDPGEIPRIIKPIVSGVADVVVGSRFLDDRLAYGMPWYRRAGAKVITKLTNSASEYGFKDAQSGFRAYNRKSLEVLKMFEDGMGISVEILINAKKHGLGISEVSSSCNYDKHLETSTHNPVRQGIEVVMSIVRLVVEEKPLTLLGIPGITSLIIGVVFGVWLLQIYAIEHRIITNVALASITFVLIGFFLSSTAISLYAISRLAKTMKTE